ncbi:MAG: peptidylprolyl isomerase [Acidobacteriaceae bacterium]
MTFRFSQLPAKRSLTIGVCALAILAQMGLIRSLHAQQVDAPNPAKAPNSLFSPTPIIPNATVVEQVIARVNDQIISESDLERAQQQLDQEARQQGLTRLQLEARQNDLLRDLIDQQLLLSRGKQMGITGDVELIRRLDEIRKQNHFDSMEALQKAAEQQGVSFEDFKANIRNSIITQQVVRDEVGSRLQVSEADVTRYYNEHKSSFDRPESVRLSEILIPTPAANGGEPSNTVVTAALAKADEVETKLKSGADFAEMSKLYSGGPTAQQGGDLGTFERGALAKALEDKTFSLKAGQYTEPIRTKQGFIILKVTQHTAGGIPTLKDVEPEVEQALYMQEMQPALRAYLTKLREEAYIDIKPGYTDSGASPLETKPVYSAYVPPSPKKKKKAVEKKRFERHGHTAKPAVEKVGTKANGKPKKIKREKIRYGQAPRESLPAQTQAEAADSAATEAGQQAQTAASAGNSAAAEAEATLLANPNADPLAPKKVEEKKTRYMDRMKLPKSARKKKKEFEEDVPPPPTVQETETQKVQSAPLGLAGDTATKKKKKKKHVKGEKKERYSAKASEKSATAQTPNAENGAQPATTAPAPKN